ncbi:MAG: chromosomal replication initiator protein DnaA [candidate division Zixibacteria bacterium]|nr:chromosomal replication initiator protein DnaA [candidate division Zixibacteria bacterium]
MKNGPQIWEDCLGLLQLKVKKQSFFTWLRPTKGLDFSDDELRIEVPNRFVAEWIEEHYPSLIREAIKSVTQKELNPIFCIRTRVEREYEPSQNRKTLTEQKTSYHPAISPQLNSRYTFDTFVVGESNRFAHAAAMAVAEAPGKTKFNPLYIYGGVGLGKTHLAQAIGHLALEGYKNIKVLYVTSETFTNDFINSISTSTMQEFVNRYRSVDVLLLDDIQFFAGKESTQVQFFHTFNALYQSGKQIVLTSDRSPKEIKGLEERLLSRFQWGLVTDIQPPDLETRIAILNKKIESDSGSVPPEVVTFIADKITSNIRELEGSLIRLLAYASLNGKELTVDLAQEVLKDSIKNGVKLITIEQIQKWVAENYNIPEDVLCSKKKTQEVVTARQVAMYLARNLTDSSLKTIGLKFGGRDHSTVIHSCTQIAENLKTIPEFKRKIDELISSLYV